MEAAGLPSLATLHLSFRLPPWSTTTRLLPPLPPRPTLDGLRWGTPGGDAEDGFPRLFGRNQHGFIYQSGNLEMGAKTNKADQNVYSPHPSQRIFLATRLACFDHGAGLSTAAYLAGPSRLRNIKYFLPERTPNRTGCSHGGRRRLRSRSSSSCRNTSLTWRLNLLGTLPFITLRIRIEEKYSPLYDADLIQEM